MRHAGHAGAQRQQQRSSADERRRKGRYAHLRFAGEHIGHAARARPVAVALLGSPKPASAAHVPAAAAARAVVVLALAVLAIAVRVAAAPPRAARPLPGSFHAARHCSTPGWSDRAGACRPLRAGPHAGEGIPESSAASRRPIPPRHRRRPSRPVAFASGRRACNAAAVGDARSDADTCAAPPPIPPRSVRPPCLTKAQTTRIPECFAGQWQDRRRTERDGRTSPGNSTTDDGRVV